MMVIRKIYISCLTWDIVLSIHIKYFVQYQVNTVIAGETFISNCHDETKTDD